MADSDPLPTNSSASSLILLGRALLIAACLSSGVLLGLTLFAGPLVLDECGTYWVIDSGLPSAVWERSLNYSAVPPLSSWIDQACVGLGGKREAVFRLPSIAFAFLAVFVVYRAGREIKDPLAGGVAALLLAWHPDAVDEVRIARCYGLVLLLSSIVLWTTVRWWKSGYSWKYAGLWTLSSAALLWTHYTSALLVAVCGGMLLVLSRAASTERRGAVIRVLITLAAVGVACIPLVPPVLRLMEWGPALNYSQQRASLRDLNDVIGPIWWAGLPAGLIVALLFASVLRNRREPTTQVDRRLLLLVVAIACLPLVIMTILSFGSLSSLASPRYRIAYVPAGACLMALLITSFRGRIAPYAAAAVTIVVAWTLSPARPWDLVRLSNVKDVEWHELNLYIKQEVADGEAIFVQSGLTEGHLVPAFADDPLFLEYAACRVTRFYVDSPHPRYALPFAWNDSSRIVQNYRELLRDWQAEPGGFWVAAAIDTDLNQHSLNEISRLAARGGYEVTDRREWPSAVLLRFRIADSYDSAPR